MKVLNTVAIALLSFAFAPAHAQAPSDPQIAGIVVTANQISVVARQAGNGFGPYQTAAGDQLLMVKKGLVPASQMTLVRDMPDTWLCHACRRNQVLSESRPQSK